MKWRHISPPGLATKNDIKRNYWNHKFWHRRNYTHKQLGIQYVSVWHHWCNICEPQIVISVICFELGRFHAYPWSHTHFYVLPPELLLLLMILNIIAWREPVERKWALVVHILIVPIRDILWWLLSVCFHLSPVDVFSSPTLLLCVVVDSFTVSLHSPTDRQMSMDRAAQHGCQWHLNTVEIQYSQPRIPCRSCLPPGSLHAPRATHSLWQRSLLSIEM